MNKTEKQIAQAASKFAKRWEGKGYEKGESQVFWLELLTEVFGIEEPSTFISFEDQVHLDHTSFIDGYIDSTHTMIEQKSLGKDLRAPIKQSDGSSLTPFQQAQRYSTGLAYSKRPRWIVTCNFSTFLVYDMENPNGEPFEIHLADLGKEHYRLRFLVETGSEHLERETRVSMQAGAIVGKLYDALLKEYKDPTNAESLSSLNVLCVRLVFCLYAEDAGIFGRHDMFHDYLARYDTIDMRNALVRLFKTLDTPLEKRDPYLQDDLAAFPYANGGLFSDEIEIPRMNEEIRELLLQHASLNFDWSEISPTIFGAVFESTLNPETRRSGGMHYTSIENIHKVIDPLFLDDLRHELDDILEEKVVSKRRKRLLDYQERLASLTFLDPACGSGNFLTETYLSLRRLENKLIRSLYEGEAMFIGGEFQNPVRVSIHQFYGIEINDFAVTVATTALWISEAQMLAETERIVARDIDFLPLKTYPNIAEGNALRTDWDTIVPKDKLNYIMGNPPFVGLSLRTTAQQEDMDMIFKGNDRAGRLDYVAAWYRKAADYMLNTRIEAAFVSTNSICQGEQVPILWEELFQKGIHINFAYRTFIWQSEASLKAHVHCVIVGFSYQERAIKTIYENEIGKKVSQINGYLVNADNVFIQLRGKANPDMPKLVQGNKPWDGGFLILSPDEREELVKKYPEADSLIRQYIGSYEFINGKERYCLWLKDVAPNKYRHIPEIMERLKGVVETRRQTKTVAVQAQADTPMLFSQIRQPESDYILVPETSSSSRKYVPMRFMSKNVIASNSTLVATDATLCLFGILTSNVHMAWLRAVCGRLKSDYRYSPSVYNNFPWPELDDEQKARIEQTAQAILDARAKYPDCSLADLYDDVAMPPELRKAHQDNDRAVMRAYGFTPGQTTESECVAKLFEMYQTLTH